MTAARQPRQALPAWQALDRHVGQLRAETLRELFDRDTIPR